ncbi:MAG: hypothetical protein LKE48_08930 [Solobacterium sp.]|jgi:hypothetical protein|nr:hypothetical protein [Solobacterium sp.]
MVGNNESAKLFLDGDDTGEGENMMKKTILAAVAAAVMSISAFPVYAEDSDTPTSGETQITMYEAKDPTYNVTIPSAIQLSTTENTQVPVTVSGIENLPTDKKISVTFAKGSGVYGRLYLEGTNPSGGSNYLMTLMLKGTDGAVKCGALENQIIGTELASFTADGSSSFELYPCALDYPGEQSGNLAIHKGVTYSGSMTYGIAVTNIQ